MDNDPPYVYDSTVDATGSGILGGPVVWIDSGTTDFSYSAKANSSNPLSPDPLESSKMRILNVDTSSIVASNGSSTAWANNQLAGKLLQITTGANHYRVYSDSVEYRGQSRYRDR